MSGSDAIAREGLDWALREGRKLFGKVADADLVLQSSMAATIEWSASRYAVDRGDQWQPGEPLKLLFAGYAGSRNTGADVRVEEMIRQVRFLLGDDLADLSILTIDPECTRGYFRTVKQLHMPQIFPKYVAGAAAEQYDLQGRRRGGDLVGEARLWWRRYFSRGWDLPYALEARAPRVPEP